MFSQNNRREIRSRLSDTPDIPNGWNRLSPDVARTLSGDLARELPLGHALSTAPFQVVAVGANDPSELLLAIGETRRAYAVVQRTRVPSVDPASPHTSFYASLSDLPGARIKLLTESPTTDRGSASAKAVSPVAIVLIAGSVVALGQFGAFPCNFIPALSVTTGFVTGASASGAIISLVRSRWIAAFCLALIFVASAAATLVSHMCP